MGNVRVKPDNLAKKLLTIRNKLELSQLGMAEKLSSEKIILRKSDISRYESGLREPPLMILLRYARLVKVSTDVLIDDEQKLP